MRRELRFSRSSFGALRTMQREKKQFVQEEQEQGAPCCWQGTEHTGGKKAFEEVLAWEEGAELVQKREPGPAGRAAQHPWKGGAGQGGMEADRISSLTGDSLALLRAQAPPWVPRDTNRDTKGTPKGKFLSCPEGTCSAQAPAAAPQALITFWGVKAHPFVLHCGPGARHCPQGHGEGTAAPCSDRHLAGLIEWPSIGWPCPR